MLASSVTRTSRTSRTSQEHHVLASSVTAGYLAQAMLASSLQEHQDN
jgi:hypothetical protein